MPLPKIHTIGISVEGGKGGKGEGDCFIFASNSAAGCGGIQKSSESKEVK